MPTQIDAIFENGVFRPDRSVKLADRQRVTLIVEPVDVADRVSFTLDPNVWDAFCVALDAPPRDLPALRRLFQDPGVFGDRTAQ